MVDPLPARLLWRHVVRRSENLAGSGHARNVVGVAKDGVNNLCQSEVDDLRVAILRDHHVGRLQIAMHNALLVSPRQAFGHFNRQLDRARRGQGSALQDVAQLLAANEFHRNEADAVGFPDLVNHGDVRMFEAGRGSRLEQEPVSAVWVGDQLSRQHFDGDVAMETSVDGAIDLAHAAHAQQRDDAIGAQGGANERTRRWSAEGYHRRRSEDAVVRQGLREERFHFHAELGVFAAGLCEIRGAIGFGPSAGCGEDALDAVAAVRRHDGLKLWPILARKRQAQAAARETDKAGVSDAGRR